MKKKTSGLANLAAAFVGIQIGSTIVATRFVINQSHPGSLAFLRYSIGSLCLLPFFLTSVRTKFAKRDIFPLGLLGITQFGIVVTFLNYALQFISSARVAFIFATLPFQAMVIAAFFGFERLTLAKSLGVLLTLLGVGFVLGENIFQNVNSQRWIGDITVLICAFAAATCSVLFRQYLKKYPTLQISSFAMFVSVIFLAFVAAGEGFFITFPHFSLKGWFAVLFIGISSGIGFYMWLWALDNTSPTKATIFLALNPITATLLGALFLGEKLSANLLFGIIFITLGLGAAHLS